MAAVSVDGLSVEYRSGGRVVRPIEDLSFEIESGEIAVVLGPSGSGKTSLLSVLGGLLTPAAGRVVVDDVDITVLGNSAAEAYRRSTVGFVFQAFNLIDSLSARENIAVPLLLAGTPRTQALERADSLVRRVGLDGHGDHAPHQLSGGQQQRVAIARGLVNDPSVLLADEPTANLDQAQTDRIIDLLGELRRDGLVMLIASHDPRMVPIADEILPLGVGSQRHAPSPQRVEYEPGEVIFTQGEWGELVYVIDTGSVELTASDSHGSQVRVGELGPGQHFGELGPILGIPRSVTARASTATVLHAHRVAEFRRLKSMDGSVSPSAGAASPPSARAAPALPGRRYRTGGRPSGDGFPPSDGI